MPRKQAPFIGREQVIKKLQSLLRKKQAAIAVIKGRRRVGKSRLINEFAKPYTYLEFTGLAPTNTTTAQAQRDEFVLQLTAQTDFPEVTINDWSKIFLLLAKQISNEPTVILLDEISWMGSKDPNFLGKLKTAWDLYFSKRSNLLLILCGSVSTWIDENILASTAFYGRISFELNLPELPLADCNKLLKALNFKGSVYEKFMLLSVMGGIPWYLEQVDPKLSAADNIIELCFTEHGLLVGEFDRIFNDIFKKQRNEIYRKIVMCLVDGQAEFNMLADKIYHRSGALTEYLHELEQSSFVSRHFTWDIKTGKQSVLSLYRLCDNYLRFYLKFIFPRRNQIERGQFKQATLESIPGLVSMLSLQFENLVLNNRNEILNLLNIKLTDIINDNPYFQHKTTKQEACQIDYLIQTKYKTLYVCEIKFSKNLLDKKVIHDVATKISRLKVPRGYACLPVLIHINGVNDGVQEADYFSHIIDFGELF